MNYSCPCTRIIKPLMRVTGKRGVKRIDAINSLLRIQGITIVRPAVLSD